MEHTECQMISQALSLSAGSMVVSGCSVFFIALLHNTTESLVMSCVFSAISVMGWNALDVLQMELYPTKLRYVSCLSLS